ncbi:putative F-box/FBD/LRR-repeat protein At5g22670 [Medicago truncatula]|uniref:putative F-box/FBD/LRR-repeat protein At5g22670 n=1 Tax=Medicago truncatula TaxID=3880 RepID=UPI00196764B2|nr:putative F-box/FBD/LRR-repeat protein At5g22670 [Medicago truncatula]
MKKTMTSRDSISTIECFPDDVRCHILSFLPTRDAAATSLLSKRWKPLWLSLRSFDFHDRYFPDFLKFSDFVISFLSSPDTLHVQSLRLSCGSGNTFQSYYSDDFNLFFNRVGLKGVPELDLQMLFSSSLPSGFYSCKTLVTVKLDNVILDYSSCVDFPLLKSLILNDFTFGSQAIMFNFLCGCPILEYLDAKSLKIGRDTPPQVEEGAKSLPKLVRARIGYCNYTPFPVRSNAQFLHPQMVLNAPLILITFSHYF